MKLSEFKATSPVLGRARSVSYQAGALTIADLEPEEAVSLLRALAQADATLDVLNALTDAPTPTNGATITKPAPAQAAEKTNGKAKTNGAIADKSKPAAKPKEPTPEAPAKEPEPAAEKPKAATAPAVEEVAEGVEVDGEHFDPGTSEIPEEVIQATRLKSIIAFLQDRGFRTEEQITKACEQIKDRVPLLARMPSIAERVPLALEVMRTG